MKAEERAKNWLMFFTKNDQAAQALGSEALQAIALLRRLLLEEAPLPFKAKCDCAWCAAFRYLEGGDEG